LPDDDDCAFAAIKATFNSSSVQEALNAAGLVATEQKLRSFDTDGTRLVAAMPRCENII